ncbi:MAG TPA: flagellar basal body rod protein FlgC [Candidatus Tetragenococcus pullicola]|nr:flagellar basal body rod protein FlgC [Candidatus Tetragenococcus pullicola]
MSVFNGLNINASGLALERLKLDTISTNIANVNTSKTENSEAYHKKSVSFSENLKKATTENQATSYGVKITGIREDPAVKEIFDPTNPNADANGYVEQSNVNTADEMVEMIQALRTYEANASALESNKSMLKKALEISKD